MLINILVQSDFTAPANGFLQVSIDSSLHVQELITKFCESKQIEENPLYCIVDAHNHVLDGKKSISSYGIQNSDKVLFCSSDDVPQFRNWKYMACAATALSIVGFFVCIFIYLGLVTVPDSYGMVLDAGSTHTQVLLYKWPGSKINDTGIVTQKDSCSIKGGIAELPTLDDVPKYLSPCLNKLRGSIPAESVDHTEIFFGATAGMRILNEKNATFAENLLSEIRAYLALTGLKFTKSHAGILTGSAEGANGWLTVNYLNNKLLENKPTWGALDLGGASTQISFQINDTHHIPSKNESLHASFQVYGRKVEVFSKSFLCYGLVQAMMRYKAYLILSDTSEKVSVTSPCDQIGYSENLNASQIFNSPCSPTLHDKQITDRNYTFNGTGNTEACYSTMQYILSQDFCQKYKLRDCISQNEVPPGFQSNNFMGFSAFGYINKSMDLGSNITRKMYKDAIIIECSKTLEHILQEYIEKGEPPKLTVQDLQALCFKRFYMYTLLSDVYQFNTDDKWSNLKFGIKINGKELGWAVGFMVNETQSIAAPPSLYGMNTIAFVLLIILFSMFLLVSIGFVVHLLKSRKRFNQTYRSLGLAA